MIKAKWKHDWERQLFIRDGADDWLRKGDDYGLWKLIRASEKSAIAWDILELICQNWVYRGEEEPPVSLLKWSFDARGCLKRPDEDPMPRHRHPRVGYKLRNNEIRHTVELLVLVGMSKTAACEAVEEAFWDSEDDLSESRIRQICQEPYWTIAELDDDVREVPRTILPRIRAYG